MSTPSSLASPLDVPAKIIGIQFGILSPQEIKNGSVVEITTRDTFLNNKPVVGGLFDPRMGVLENGQICPTDGHNYVDTPGYCGHIELPVPVIPVQFREPVRKVLNCVCSQCSKLLISKSKYAYVSEYSAADRWKFCNERILRVKRCGDDSEDGCGAACPKYRKEGISAIYAVWRSGSNKSENKEEIQMPVEQILQILRRISDDDITFMGFNPKFSRPDWMVFVRIPVAPPAVRPSVKHDAQQRSEDDLTHVYVNIYKTAGTLKDKMAVGADARVIKDWTELLNYFVSVLFDNNIPGVASAAQRTGRPLRTIKTRMNGKGGIMRCNLMAKRVDFSARSVITSEPNISVVEIRVPEQIASNLTRPEEVNERNRLYLTQLVRNGPDVYPGAKTLVRGRSKQAISLKYHLNRASIVLEVGDIVHRHMLTGDYVLFNRQPSLHKMSMQGHRAVISGISKTFGLNVAVTKPYNADFDGDEMNLHLPQSPEAEAELRYLAAVPNQIISPANNSAIIGIFQDSLLGAYLFTREGVRMKMPEAMRLLARFDRLNVAKLHEAVRVEDGTVSSFDVLSQIMPPLSMKYKSKMFNDEKDDMRTSNAVIEIRNGRYIRGQMEKGVFGATSRGLLQRICNDFGNAACARFIDDFQNIITEYMKTCSYSVGISDLISNEKTQQEITAIVAAKKNEVKNMIDQMQLGIFDNDSGRPNSEEFEMRANMMLNQATDQTGRVAKKNLTESRFLAMSECGSKGSSLNLTFMTGVVGQQNVENKRIPNNFEGRTLPHFTKYNDMPEARGFIESSYVNGLTAIELFFHAMGGRIGLIDTAVKSVTWETPVVLVEQSVAKQVRIGEWIDGKLKSAYAAGGPVQKFAARNMELLELGAGADSGVFIPTTDMDGHVSWGAITAVTRHDPGERLYKITTRSGRSVTVTESKSLLIWNAAEGRLEETDTPLIKVGDCVPVTEKLCDFGVANSTSATVPVPTHLQLDGIPDGMEMNYENGTFLGLFVAMGFYYSQTPHKICLIHINPTVRAFVQNWFDKHGIHWTINKCTVVGYSSVYARAILKLVGSDADHKHQHLPAESFVGPIEFAKGLLNGIISGDGIITDGSICCSFRSERVIQDVSLLCSRLGIVGRMRTSMSLGEPDYYYTIYSKWGELFCQQIDLLHPEKKEDLNAIQWAVNKTNETAKLTKNWTTHNDIVLDPIASIEVISKNLPAKVYDLTVPDTLNFGLANGLQVRDTSVTGYIQRRLIKALEDLKVEYDMTVRSNNGTIMQFAYGDDGIDSTKIESQQMPLLTMQVQDIYAHFLMLDEDNKASVLSNIFTKEALRSHKAQYAEYMLATEKRVEWMLRMRTVLARNVFRWKNESTVNAPVAFSYIINNVRGQCEISMSSLSDLSLLEAMQMIESYYDRLLRTMKRSPPTELFRLLYFYYLSPKDLVVMKRFNRAALTLLLETVTLRYKQAVVAPGEMVGIIAGQSIGEISTQMTLNTFHMAGVSAKSNVTRGVPRIEEILSLTTEIKNPSLVVYLHPNDETSKEKAQQYMNMLEYTKLGDLFAKAPEICFDPDDLNTLFETDREMITQYKAFEQISQDCGDEFVSGVVAAAASNVVVRPSKWILRLTLKPDVMFEKNITMDDISFALKKKYGNKVSCVYSDFNSQELIFRIRINEILKTAAAKKRGKAQPLDQNDNIHLFNKFSNELANDFILRGVQGIRKAIPRKLVDTIVEEGGSYPRKDIYVLDTVGSSLLEVLGLDFIDSTRTISNSIQEVYNVLGIEAARQVIIDELIDVISYDGTYINMRHVQTLALRMTYNHKLISISRHSLNVDNIGTIAKASNEQTNLALLNAAQHSELDPVRGISASIMLAQPIPAGTGAFQLLIDTDKMRTMEEKTSYEKSSAREKIDSFFAASGRAGGEQDECGRETTQIMNNVSTIHAEHIIDDTHYDPGF